MKRSDTPHGELGRLAAEERAAWDALESAFRAVKDALAAPETSDERLARLFVELSEARARWVATARAKQDFTDDAVLRLNVAFTTRSRLRAAK